jgi:hypothetical protein
MVHKNCGTWALRAHSLPEIDLRISGLLHWKWSSIVQTTYYLICYLKLTPYFTVKGAFTDPLISGNDPLFYCQGATGPPMQFSGMNTVYLIKKCKTDDVKLIRYQFWWTRCAFRLLKSLQAEKVGNPGEKNRLPDQEIGLAMGITGRKWLVTPPTLGYMQMSVFAQFLVLNYEMNRSFPSEKATVCRFCYTY